MKTKKFTLRTYLFSIFALFFLYNIANAFETGYCDVKKSASEFYRISWYTYEHENGHTVVDTSFGQTTDFRLEQNFISSMSGTTGKAKWEFSNKQNLSKQYITSPIFTWNIKGTTADNIPINGTGYCIQDMSNGDIHEVHSTVTRPIAKSTQIELLSYQNCSSPSATDKSPQSLDINTPLLEKKKCCGCVVS